MDLELRLERYRAIEQRRQRPLVVYATSTRSGLAVMMAADAVREFIDQLDDIPADTTSVDVLIHSTGGDALTAWKLMSVLRERFTSVSVLVPYMAFSAATIFALGADEIVMHPHASLGPIDPQISIRLPDGKRRQFAFEDVGAFLRFLSKDTGITEQAHISSATDKLFSVVDPVQVGAAKRASELSTDVGERLLQMHMTGDDAGRARTIAEGLNKSFYAHGDAVSRSRGRTLNLKIAPDDQETERLLWQAYLGLESYLQLREPYRPLNHYLGNGGAIPTTPALNLPANTPPNVANQIWNQVAQTAMQQALGQPATQVPYDMVLAVVESVRRASEIRGSGFLTAARVMSGEVQVVSTDTGGRWANVPIPAPAAVGGNAV